MFANRTTYKPRLTVAPQQSLMDVVRSSTFPLPGEAEFPGLPATPNALLRMELWLSSFAPDLQEVTDIIRNDIGLTSQVLRLAAREIKESPDKVIGISEIVILVGVEKLKALAARTPSLSVHLASQAASRACERFWTHSRLTALIAEELAYQFFDVNLEEAYLAGLFFRLDELPSLLGWPTQDSDTKDSRQLGTRMAKAWGFPRDLVAVIGGDPQLCHTRTACALLDIARDADLWASRLESLAARESKSAHPKSHAYRLGIG